MKIRLLLIGLFAIALCSSFFIFKKKPKDKWVCTCHQPTSPHKINRTGAYVIMAWSATGGDHIHHYNYVYYTNNGGTSSGQTSSEQMTIYDNNKGGTLTVTPICQDVTQPTPYPQCTGTPSSGGWTAN
jgi:hypothetical protein